MTNEQTFPAWLNIDAVVPPTLRDRMPACRVSANELVTAVCAFSDEWAPYLIDLAEHTQAVLGDDLADLACEIQDKMGTEIVRRKLRLARCVITRILDDDEISCDYEELCDSATTESQAASIRWLEELRDTKIDDVVEEGSYDGS